MKIKVKTPFMDKYTGTTYQIGDELDVSVGRINEILTVGNFIELVEQTEQTEEQEREETSDDAPKRSTRRNRK